MSYSNVFSAIKNYKKAVISFLIIVGTSIIFRPLLESVISKIFVQNILVYVESNRINDIVFLILTFSYLLICIWKVKNRYVPSPKVLITLLAVLLFYTHYRFFNDIWSYTPFTFNKSLKYSDILFAICFSNFLLIFRRKQRPKDETKIPFFDDQPVTSDNSDILGYSPYSELIIGKINDSEFDKSFAIGINGKWGYGKTSFINLIKKNIYRNGVIEIEFNPWNSHTPKSIIEDFFESMRDGLSPYHSSLSKQIVNYSKKLVSINDNSITQSVREAVSNLYGSESLSEMHEEINSAIKKIDRKIIVYIDDLDRLDKDEIIEVIRLIRNTANFHNTFFIVAYDRSYIVNALKYLSEYNHERFLEKIFQLEINLPAFDPQILRNELFKRLKNIFPKRHHEEIKEAVIGSVYDKDPKYLEKMLESMRDVTRLTNTLALNTGNLLGEIIFRDFLRLELFRIKFSAVYDLLHQKTEQFFISSKSSGGNNFYRLRKTDESNTNRNNKNTELESYISNNLADLAVKKSDIQIIIEYLETIFCDWYVDTQRSPVALSVVYPSKFKIYFSYGIVNGMLSEVEFSKACDLPQKQFNQTITKWVNNGLEFELQKRFSQIVAYDNKEHFEKMITGIFHFANQNTHYPESVYNHFVGYNGRDLLYDQLNNRENRLLNLYENTIDLENFIIDQFQKAPSPFSFEAGLLEYINNEFQHADYDDIFPLSKDKRTEIIEGYFSDYCSKARKLDQHIWRLYHNCGQTHWTNTGSRYEGEKIVTSNTKKIFINFIKEKDLNRFLFDITQVNFRDKENIGISAKTVFQLFENWNNFKEFLEKQDQQRWSYLNEFLALFYKIEANGFKETVNFEFTVIPIEDKF